MAVMSFFIVDGSGINATEAISYFGIIAPLLGIIYTLWRVIYNLYFHPLASFPGPTYAVISNLWYAFAWPGGRWPFILEELHKKYGPVVRYAPNDLDFSTLQAYQDIHGHIKQGKQTFLKADFYTPESGVSRSIVSTRDLIEHRQIRRNLSHAFSAKALRTQTTVILSFVNMWISQIEKLGDVAEGINMEEWYNWLTFDIIGDLAFGESFGGVENTKTHPWVSTIKESLYATIFTDVFRRVPFLDWFPWIVRPSNLPAGRKRTLKYSHDLALKRMQMGNDRDDFFGHLISKKGTDFSEDVLAVNANTLIIAGSETTATFLAGVTYYLLKNPTTLQRLCQEVRSTFQDPEQINGDTTQGLPYLMGVMEEGLRIFPPVPAGLHRESPGATVDGHYVPRGFVVSTSVWTMSHTEASFHDARGFHPERWLPENHEWHEERFKDDVKEMSKPFGMGPRVCLGLNMAYLEMRIILTRLALEFDWELISKEVDWERDIDLKFLWRKPQLNVRFRPRKLKVAGDEH